MIKETKNKFILILLVMLLSALAASCTIGMGSLDDVLEKNDLTAQITYFSNGGYFNDNLSIVSRDIYYKENSKAFEITSSSNTKVERDEYVYVGWYTVKTVSIAGEYYFVCDLPVETLSAYKLNDKEVVFENDGNYVVKITDYVELLKTDMVPVLALNEQFDFSSTLLKRGDRLYLAAKWVPEQSVEFVLITEDCDGIIVTDNGESKNLASGSIVKKSSFGSSNTYSMPSYYLSPVDADDATFVDYYVYEEGATLDNLTLLTHSIERPADGSNVKVLVKYVYGDWNIIREAKDVKSIFTFPSEKHYVSRDINCSGENAVNRITGNFSGTIRGNGYTITGAKVQAQRMTTGDSISLFGIMTASATIEDITFKDITIVCTTRKLENSFINVYLIAYRIEEDAAPTLTDLNLDGVKIDITLADGVSVENLPYGSSGYDVSNWICAGYADNAEFLAAYPTVNVENYHLLINETVIASDNTAA